MDNLSSVTPIARSPVVKTPGGVRAIQRAIKAQVTRTPDNEQYQDLLADSFATCYMSDPQMREDIPPDRAVNAELMKWALDNPIFMSGRQNSISNIAVSLATGSMLYSTLASDKTLEEVRDSQDVAAKEEEQAREDEKASLQAAIEGNQEIAEKKLKSANRHHFEAERLAHEAVNKVEKLREDVFGKQLMSKAVERANEAGQEIAATMAAWGIDPGDIQTQDVGPILALANKDNDALAKIANLAGRMEKVASRSIASVIEGYNGPTVEVSTTQNPLRMFQTELAYTFSKQVPLALRARRIARFVQQGLIGWKPKSEGKQAGAFITMTDSSGSMMGENDIAAKAINIGLARAADAASGRYYELHQFSTQRDGLISYRKPEGWKSLIEWAGKGIYGGTDFDYALNMSMDLLEAMGEKDRKDADLFFITDGFAYISDDTLTRWNKFQQETGTRLFVVNLGVSINAQLETMADVLIGVPNTRGRFMEEMEMIVDKIATGIAKHMVS